MSDPVTNVEIEDVLSSIRKLVSDGDRARTRDPAPSAAESDEAQPVEAPQAPDPLPEDKPDRLVLTPAFLVSDSAVADHEDDAQEGGAEAEAITPRDDADIEVARAEDEADPAIDVGGTDDEQMDEPPIQLTQMVWPEPTPDAPEVAIGDQYSQDDDTAARGQDAPATGTDRSKLVATIAELEAAISGEDEDFEPDGSEQQPTTSAWPRPAPVAADAIEEADLAEGHEDVAEQTDTTAPAPTEELPRSAMEDADVPFTFARAQNAAKDMDASDVDPSGADDFHEEDDLDGLLDMGGASIDEDALRELVAQVVREELTGPLGERITRNVRKLVRREIYRILSSQEFD